MDKICIVKRVRGYYLVYWVAWILLFTGRLITIKKADPFWPAFLNGINRYVNRLNLPGIALGFEIINF